MLRSVLSILAGAIAWPALFLTSNQILFRLFPDQYDADLLTHSAGLLTLTLLLSMLFSIVAGWLTAVVAGRSATAHASVLGVIQLAIGIAVQLQYWDRIPLWYHLAFLALLVPATAFGGWLRSRG